VTISNPDNLLAAFQLVVPFQKVTTPAVALGAPQSLWYLNGAPGAGSASATLNGATYSSSSSVPAGAIYHVDPAGGGSAYLARFLAYAPTISTLLLCDRLWDNQLTINSTGSQSITSPTWPARDNTGTTNGAGVQLAIEVSASTSATAAALTNVTYTNSAGTASHTAGFLDVPTGSTANIGRFYRLALQAGDYGVQSVQSAQFTTAWTSGTIHLVAYRVIALLSLQAICVGNSIDPLTGGMPQLYNGVCPFVVYHPNVATAGIIAGIYQEAQG
jgi:hypothetical protein